MTGPNRKAFVYGTLMAPQVLSRVCDKHLLTNRQTKLLVRPAILKGFRRHRVLHCDYPAILPSDSNPDTELKGMLVENLTDEDVRLLDAFEGDEYGRRFVEVKPVVPSETGEATDDDGDVVVAAETYVWVGGEDALEDADWDFDEFVRDKIFRWIGAAGAVEYAEVDEAAGGKPDPTGGRGL